MTRTFSSLVAAALLAFCAPAFAQGAMMSGDKMSGDKMSGDNMMSGDKMMAPHFVAYTDSAFAAAQKAGKPILVAIAADWCPVCKSQEMTLNKLMMDPAYAKAVFLRVDFDGQKPAVKKFKAKMQSTLITFRGARETGRISYTADAAKVTALAANVKSAG